VSHPARFLTSHFDVAEVSSLFAEATHICGATVADDGKADGEAACGACGFNPNAPFRETTCPFSTLYWDFLLRHESQAGGDPRLAAPMSALAGLKPGDRAMIRQRAMAIRFNAGRLPAATDVRPIA
jgi:hypothetical protein